MSFLRSVCKNIVDVCLAYIALRLSLMLFSWESQLVRCAQLYLEIYVSENQRVLTMRAAV